MLESGEQRYLKATNNKNKGREPVWPLRLSFLFRKVVVCGHCPVTLSLAVNETLKWLSSLPILMQGSFWW